MESNNTSTITEFLINGFLGFKHFHTLFSVTFLLMYIITLMGNITFLYVTLVEPRLKTPMYFFLFHFSTAEVTYTSVIVPKALSVLLSGCRTITFISCLAQLYFFVALVFTECFLLLLMAIDRYVAICHPLQYDTILTGTFTLKLALTAWSVGFLVPVGPMFLIGRLHFCGSNTINHFFCDIVPLLQLACSDTSQLKRLVFLYATTIGATTTSFIIVSYVFIFYVIATFPPGTGKQKALSTCLSHLIVVFMFYGTGMLVYIRPMGKTSTDQHKVLSVFYTMVPPLMNPFIYSLRNKEVQSAIRKATCEKYKRLSVEPHVKSIKDFL